MPPDRALAGYLAKRGLTSPWSVSGASGTAYRGAVVIPSLAEHDRLAATLDSLAANPPEFIRRFLVLVVVNHRLDAPLEDRRDNLATLSLLKELSRSLPLELAWVDAASPGLELPLRGGGVGMARKIGFDLSLSRLSWDREPVLIALDADTLVQPDYLAAIEHHFDRVTAGGAVIPFRHQTAPTLREQETIDLYELYLRSYVHGLSLAGSPYAFHTVGSAMACSAVAYLRAGGMNSRTAGEDFYFLQQLKKTSGISQVCGTVVHPSPRPSHRVPFGTGRSVSRTLAGEKGIITFYRPECYSILAEWLALAASSWNKPGDMLISAAGNISPLLGRYLDRERFVEAWDRIGKVKKEEQVFMAGFHEWFDALRTMKLIHHLSAYRFPRCGFEEGAAKLLVTEGSELPADITGLLESLRSIQNPNSA